MWLWSQVGNVPANAAYFGGYELGKALVPGVLRLGDEVRSAGTAAPLLVAALESARMHG